MLTKLGGGGLHVSFGRVRRARIHTALTAAFSPDGLVPLLHAVVLALAGLQWRVDITISNSSLLRVMKPSILMQMTLSDGEIKTFELPIEQFHRSLRAALPSWHSLDAFASWTLVDDGALGGGRGAR